jgi:K+/H+ antiporter YhaU regulatory subunit KhtT
VVAIARGANVQINPGPDAHVDAGDRLAVIGTAAQIQAALASVQAPSSPRAS